MLLNVSAKNPGHRSQLPVLRAVATLEACKGIAVILAACGVILLMHHDPWDVAWDLLNFLHISPDHHFAQVFLDWSDTLTTSKLWTVVGAAFAYSALRFVEAYGLWNATAWAEWLAMISGAIYLPFEGYAMFRHPHPFNLAVLLINIAIVLYMGYLRMAARREREARHHRIPTGALSDPR